MANRISRKKKSKKNHKKRPPGNTCRCYTIDNFGKKQYIRLTRDHFGCHLNFYNSHPKRLTTRDIDWIRKYYPFYKIQIER